MQRLTLDYLPAEAFCDPVVWSYDVRSVDKPHCHAFHEILWIEAGEGIHAINGEIRHMSPGYVALIRPQDGHAFSALAGGPPLRLCNVPFRSELWHRLRRAHFGARVVFFQCGTITDREHWLNGPELERLRALSADLFAGATDAFSTSAFLSGLLAFLSNRQRSQRDADTAPDWLLRAREGIQSFPRFVDGLPEFVRLAGRSPEHVARECRRHFGCAPRELVQDARLSHARTRLCTSTDAIIDIAHECGFENLGHFYALFRSRHGMPPREYRLRQGSSARPVGAARESRGPENTFSKPDS